MATVNKERCFSGGIGGQTKINGKTTTMITKKAGSKYSRWEISQSVFVCFEGISIIEIYPVHMYEPYRCPFDKLVRRGEERKILLASA